jgi:serine/threonine-protein kinase
MTRQEYAKVREVFLRACGLPPERRTAELESAFPGAEGHRLRLEVLALLEHHERSSRMMAVDVHAPAEPGSSRSQREDRTILVGEGEEIVFSPRGGSGSSRARSSRGGTSTTEVYHGRFTPGTVLADRYRIVALLGEGGMGEVYRADDLRLNQPVALKFLSEDLSGDEQRLRDLHEEVRVARQVSHPNVCRVYDIEEVHEPAGASHYFICMEYVDGENLDGLLRRIGRLPEDKAVEIAQQLCAGLAAVHDLGLFHRDLKPSNILIDGRGHAKIADFGLAALGPGLEAGLAAGTPGYMAPEVLRGQPVSVQSELYSLGLVLYEMFTGRRAYKAERAADLLKLQRESDPSAPSTVLETINPLVERVIARCLERDPQRRPRSARAVAAALPGGDPLAAALAAGETPSPELVAAAGAHGGVAPARAAVLAAALVAMLALIVVLADRAFLVSRAALDKPPEVLAERAREVLRAARFDPAGKHQAWGFLYDEGALLRPVSKEEAARRWADLRAGRHSVIRFWFQATNEPVADHDPFRGRQADEAPPLRPGSMGVVLDTRGNLRQLTVMHAGNFSPGPAPREVDWDVLLALAGQGQTSFTAAVPTRIPPVFADQRKAWNAILPSSPEQEVIIEGAALENRPVYFDVRPAVAPKRASSLSRTFVGRQLDLLLFLLILVAGFALALRNLRSGKGDRQGAMRLAAFVFGAQLVGWLLANSYTASLQAIVRQLTMNLANCLFMAATAWMYYVAIEPYVRRVWPQAVISWNRLLSGRLADPLVGRDILIGAVTGAAVVLIIQLDSLAPGWLGLAEGRPVLPWGRLDALNGTREAASVLFSIILTAIYMGLGTLLLVVLSRSATGSEWPTVLLPAAIYTAIFALQGANAYLSWLFWGAIWVAVMWVLVRIGLVAWIAAAATAMTLGAFPITSDWTKWYAGQGVFALGLVLALAVFGLATGVARPVPPRRELAL